jgi:hypothetical protein
MWYNSSYFKSNRMNYTTFHCSSQIQNPTITRGVRQFLHITHLNLARQLEIVVPQTAHLLLRRPLARNKALPQMAIPLRSIGAGQLGGSAT